MTTVQEILTAKRNANKDIEGCSFPNRTRRRYSFRDAVSREAISVIAEIKRSSPSHGSFGVDVDALHSAYLEAGVDALSILSDRHFGMSAEDFQRLAEKADRPVLRKDFILSEDQVRESESLGADAILLIASFLDAGELARLGSLARDLGLDVLYEIHDAAELEKLPRDAEIIGVNNRNLSVGDYATDRSLSTSLLERLPAAAFKVAESGYERAEDVPEGYDAALVGAGLIRMFAREGKVDSLVADFHRRVRVKA